MNAKDPSVLDLFRQTALQEPERDLYIFVDGKGRDQERLTYGAFDRAIQNVGAFLLNDLGLTPGDRVLLVYPPSPEFVIAFVGCMDAGIIPVPVPPPNPFKPDLKSFETVARDSGSVAILSNKSYLRTRRLAAAKNLFSKRNGSWTDLPWHKTDDLKEASAPRVTINPDETAFLQYTSGSTSAPKGVMISHGNINHQLRINAEDLNITANSRAVLWVPHFHDFCLVSGICSVLHGNGALYLMSPLTFLRRPHLWFEVLSRVRATHTAAPDFAYRLAVRKTTPEQRQGWDLSQLEIAMSAAEPIRASTVDGFIDAFADSGFSPEAFCPAYGLAEHTVGVSVAGKRRLSVDRADLELRRRVTAVDAQDDDSNALTLFSCGPPSDLVDVRIVDPETLEELPQGAVGEIWVDSPSKALGYYGLEDVSKETFRAQIAGSKHPRGFLRTGDLGFLADGEVFVTGRLKDLIIVRGRNIYPQDIEESVFSSHPMIRPGRAVAFATDGQARDEIVVLLEVDAKKVDADRLDEVTHAARTSIQSEHGIACDILLIAPPGEILKTTSGKVRRQACRQAYLDGSLDSRLLRRDVRARPAGAH